MNNPYTRLRHQFLAFISSVQFPRKTHLTYFPLEKINNGVGFDMHDIFIRVDALNKVGFEVLLEIQDDGLYVVARKKVEPPSLP